MFSARGDTNLPPERLKRMARSIAAIFLAPCIAALLQVGPPPAAQQRAAKSPYMPLGESMTPPFSFLLFCDRKPMRCPISEDIRQIPFNAANRQILENVQRSVNRELRSGLERWTDNAARTDCTDYALTKRSRLLDTGYPASALLIAVAFVPSGEGHLVLVVVTDQGDFVLDNLRATVVRWDQLPYRWVMRSTPQNPRRWQTVLPKYIGPGFESFDIDICR